MPSGVRHPTCFAWIAPMARQRRFDAEHPDAIAARQRVLSMIDMLPPAALVQLVKEKPSLRGMVLGNLAELLFEQHVPRNYPAIAAADIIGHDDHDRAVNKSDRTITFRGRKYTIQVKSVQTGSIKREVAVKRLCATVQNDGSDMRKVVFANGSDVTTTCYLRGQYDILAVPLFPFTGTDAFAYKKNEDCRLTQDGRYTDYQRRQLLATTEIITWPLAQDWQTNLLMLLTPEAGSPIGYTDVVTEPGGEVRVRETGAVILPNKDQEV